MSNAPTVLMNLVPLVRATCQSATDATATTITPDDSGTLFVDRSTSAHTYTLPAVADCKGKHFLFVKVGSGDMVIAGGTTDKMVAFNDAAADSVAFSTASEKIGGAMLIIGDGDYYYAFNISAGANTVTVAT